MGLVDSTERMSKEQLTKPETKSVEPTYKVNFWQTVGGDGAMMTVSRALAVNDRITLCASRDGVVVLRRYGMS